ncbi:hypothetical protein [Chitinophaga varians]|uniref:hypothetical protein n=1 Tax=Chitinophaga varians TaxID=2202339 RepID=UPI00165FD384|nr:hypothetical protein [Chitinophaga varians]MBC9913194.1 hypothetical protein [Chitinophaga varians]
MKQELIQQLLGGIELIPFTVAVFYAFVGAILNLLLHANKRDVNAPGSPANFSWKFLIRDNCSRILTGALLILICVRFSQELLGQQLTMYLAFVIGFSIDRLAGLIKKLDNK